MTDTVDARYIPIDLAEMVFLDKDSGAPLSGGIFTTYRDNQPQTLKPMYQITGTSPNYTFTQLTDPLILSSIGTFVDSMGMPIIPYYLPWLVVNNVITDTPDFYYVVVQNSGGVNQFTRYNMPYPIGGGSGPIPPSAIASTYTNQISNPEFSEVLFDTTPASYTYTFAAGANQVVNIAPNWDIVVSCSDAATVTVAQKRPA